MFPRRFGHYQLLRQLGQGRCMVSEAEDTTSGQRVVVKIFGDSSASQGLRDRLQRDMSAARQLREPHIVSIEHWGEIDGQRYLEMPLLDGTDLQPLRDRDAPLSPAEAVNIAGQIAEALAAAHRGGVVHSGVAP